MVDAAAGIDTLDSADDGLLFLGPPSVLLRCNPGLTLSDEPEDEFVLVRECWLFAFCAISFSCCASLACVSYGCLLSTFLVTACGMLPNEALIPGFEKLKSMLGSTLTDVATNEPGCEYDDSPMALAAKEPAGAGDDMPCRP
jgi:hypothetical protein